MQLTGISMINQAFITEYRKVFSFLVNQAEYPSIRYAFKRGSIALIEDNRDSHPDIHVWYNL